MTDTGDDFPPEHPDAYQFDVGDVVAFDAVDIDGEVWEVVEYQFLYDAYENESIGPGWARRYMLSQPDADGDVKATAVVAEDELIDHTDPARDANERETWPTREDLEAQTRRLG